MLRDTDSVAVIGLGRFGQALALELARWGVEVLGVDSDEQVVQDLRDELTQVAQADATRRDALEQLGVAGFSHAVVAVGSHLEASILTCSWLLRLGVPELWAKATSPAHGQILGQLGVGHVVYPEADMGRRVAHVLRGAVVDYQDIGGGFATVTATVPPALVGRPLDAAAFRAEHDLNLVAVRRPDGPWRHLEPGTAPEADDMVVVVGPAEVAERFAHLGRPRRSRRQ